jgi:cytochrome c oxidase subunit 3
MLKILKKDQQKHPFHLVDPSPWPLVASLGALFITYGGTMYMHFYKGGSFLFCIGLLTIIYVMYVWWRDIVREGSFEGQHTFIVQKGLRIGMILFIVSEIMFFFAFFWAFFHSSFSPVPEIGGVWPPKEITLINPWEIPLLNTVLLLSSGATVTWAHHAIIAGDKKNALLSLLITILFAIIFTLFQLFEYFNSPFSISDSVYGSTFYLTTGFHGFHVFVGTCFLTVCLFRLYNYHFTRTHHFGFEAAAWYWHFVDVVWLFLFITVYWWGS